MSDDTPFYPGFHNLWSKEWVADAWIPPETPSLGEVTEGPPPYDRGTFPVPAPPPVVLGGSDCIRSGESNPPPYPQRPLVLGVDAACWTRAGVPVPNAPPSLPWIWQRPEELAGFASHESVRRWINVGTLGRDAVNSAIGQLPTCLVTGPGGLRCLEFRHAQALFYQPGALVTGDSTVYLVGQVRNDGASAVRVGPWLPDTTSVSNRILGTGFHFAITQDSDNALTITPGGAVGDVTTWWLWRSPARIRLASTAGGDSSLVPATLPTITISAIAASLASPSVSRLCNVSELLVWDRLLSPAEHEAVMAYLLARYG